MDFKYIMKLTPTALKTFLTWLAVFLGVIVINTGFIYAATSLGYDRSVGQVGYLALAFLGVAYLVAHMHAKLAAREEDRKADQKAFKESLEAKSA